jgi:hypothetical protein
MGYYKFVCNWQTEKECFYRRLFANGSKEVRETDATLDVSEGDTLFLHRYNSAPDRHGFLYGPFTAASDAQENIAEEAWSYVDEFPWQVQIEIDEPVYSRNLKALYERTDDPYVKIVGYAQSFAEREGLWLTGEVREGDQILEL